VISKIKTAQEFKYRTFLCDEVRICINCNYDDSFSITSYREIINRIPKFTIENAIEHANARIPIGSDLGWWNGMGLLISEFNYQDRIKFMLWIKEQYKPSFKKWLLNICNRINF